jgi:hypothetical protein
MSKILKLSSVLLLTCLLSGMAINVSQDAALGSSISGKPCPKKWTTKLVQGKKYTCVTVNKKLVWNKGVSIKPAAVAKPNLTPSPAAQPTASPSQEPPLNPKEQLAKDILKVFNEGKSAGFKFQVKTCSNVNKAKSDETIKAYEDALRFWGSFYTPTKPMSWVMFSEKDFDCWLANVREIEGPSGDTKVWNPTTNIMGHCQLSPSSFCGYGTGVKRDGVFVQYNAIGSAYGRSPEPSVVNHEAVHFYQMSLQSENVTTSQVNTLPPWFIEGQANLIGLTIANRGLATSHRNMEMGRLKMVLVGSGTDTSEQWYQRLVSLDTQHSYVFQNELGYSLGWFALEPVYQKYGLQKMHELLLAVNKGMTFDQATVSVLGVSKQDLYKQIANYLAEEVN